MANLIIRKKSGGIWEHFPSDAPMFILSNFYVKVDEPYFQIQEIGGSQRKRYLVSEISLYDDTVSGAIESFTNLTGLMQRLKSLGYPPFSETSDGGNSAVANGFTLLGSVSKLSNTITVGYGFQWFIYQNSYSNLGEFVFSIDLETDGFSRKDIIVANTNNSFELIKGVSSLGENTAFQPLTPIGRILLTEVEIFGSTVSSPSQPTTGDIYLEKAFFSTFTISNIVGELQTVAVNSKCGGIKFTGGITKFGGVQRNTQNYLLGLPFFLENDTDHDIALEHNNPNGNVKFIYPGAVDKIIKPNEVFYFLQTYKSAGVFENKFIGSSSSETLEFRFTDNKTLSLSGGKSFGYLTNGMTTDRIGKTTAEFLDDVLIEYLTPSFSSFSITSQPTTVEVGTILSGNRSFAFGFSNAGNVKADSVSIIEITSGVDPDIVLASGKPKTSPQVADIGFVDFTQGQLEIQEWKATAENTNDIVFSSGIFRVSRLYPIFYGKSAVSPTINQSLINSGTKLVSSSTGTVNINFGASGEFIWFAIPKSSVSKTKWFVTELNQGSIGGVSNLFGDESILEINSPATPVVMWNNIEYKIYVSNTPTSTSGVMQLRNN